MITALIIAVVLVSLAVAGLVVTAAVLGRPQGRHRSDEAARWLRPLHADTPAPGAAPGQALSPAPLSKAPEAAPRAGAAGAGPALSTPGQGQHPFRPVIMQFPGGEVGILGADGRWHIKPLAWQPGIRETGGLSALVRPGRVAYEAWRDAAVNQ